MKIEMVKRQVQTWIERKRTGSEEWLVVTRRPSSDACPLENRASRDATDQRTPGIAIMITSRPDQSV